MAIYDIKFPDCHSRIVIKLKNGEKIKGKELNSTKTHTVYETLHHAYNDGKDIHLAINDAEVICIQNDKVKEITAEKV